ncbi:hypothetical protein TPE_1624 [Treponema pedis str. T A4]|uniref:Uncharacterized protein n=2 Tax=Treponema pedis TaxID=409322 RepID=S6A0B4_9SPIR|nr:hypothetical protein TPE_1624 [Treponema pedis str. T A4]
MGPKARRSSMALKQKSLIFLLFLYIISIVYGESFRIIEKKDDWIISISEECENLYTIEVVNIRKKQNIKIEKKISQPEPRMYWLNNDLLRIDFGSVFAPDISSYFFSIKRERISEELFFATNFIDLKNELVLCADLNISVVDIFNPDKSYVLILPDDMFHAACYWFCIGKNTKFDNGFLFLEYLVENSSMETYRIKKYKIPILPKEQKKLLEEKKIEGDTFYSFTKELTGKDVNKVIQTIEEYWSSGKYNELIEYLKSFLMTNVMIGFVLILALFISFIA